MPGDAERVDVARATILVLVEHPRARVTTCRRLTHAGYRVLEAVDAAEAADVLSMRHARIDLVLIGPDKQGEARGGVVTRVLSIRPDQRLAFISIGSPRSVIQPLDRSAAVAVPLPATGVTRPLDPDGLLTSVALALNSRKSRSEAMRPLVSAAGLRSVGPARRPVKQVRRPEA